MKLCVTLVIGLKLLAKVSEVQVILSPPKTEEASSYKNKESYPATKEDLLKRVENIDIFPRRICSEPHGGQWRSDNVKIIGTVIGNNYGLRLTQKPDSPPRP